MSLAVLPRFGEGALASRRLGPLRLQFLN